MWQRMVKLMDITTSTEKWHWHIVWIILKNIRDPILPTMQSFWKNFLRNMRRRFLKTAHGAVCTASSDGVMIAVVIQEEIPHGINGGANHFVIHWIGFAMNRLSYLM